jgi:nitrate/TMAO reductase-like tetraheme cytochrome c subunit
VNAKLKKSLKKFTGFVLLLGFAILLIFTYFDSKTADYTIPLHDQNEQESEVEVTPISNLSCIECHSSLSDLGNESLTIPGGDWFTSTHQEVGTTCPDCHGGDSTEPTDAMTGVNFVGKPDRESIPDICGNCHVEIFEEYQTSIHYSYITNNETNETSLASVCTDCHGIHHIERSNNPESPVYFQNSPETCAFCHESKHYTYEDSYHGIFIRYGNRNAATCADCHGNHDNLPPDDPESKVHPDNLPETCAKCHGNNLDVKVAQGYQHFAEGSGSPDLVFNSDVLDIKEKPYYIGPFDTRFWVPLFFNIITFVIIPSIFILIMAENLGRKISRRLSSWKKKK